MSVYKIWQLYSATKQLCWLNWPFMNKRQLKERMYIIQRSEKGISCFLEWEEGLTKILFCCFVFVFWDRVSLCSPGTHSVDQAGLKLSDPPASASQVLGLKECSTTARLKLNLPLKKAAVKSQAHLSTAKPPDVSWRGQVHLSARLNPVRYQSLKQPSRELTLKTYTMKLLRRSPKESRDRKRIPPSFPSFHFLPSFSI